MKSDGSLFDESDIHINKIIVTSNPVNDNPYAFLCTTEGSTLSGMTDTRAIIKRIEFDKNCCRPVRVNNTTASNCFNVCHLEIDSVALTDEQPIHPTLFFTSAGKSIMHVKINRIDGINFKNLTKPYNPPNEGWKVIGFGAVQGAELYAEIDDFLKGEPPNDIEEFLGWASDEGTRVVGYAKIKASGIRRVRKQDNNEAVFSFIG